MIDMGTFAIPCIFPVHVRRDIFSLAFPSTHFRRVGILKIGILDCAGRTHAEVFLNLKRVFLESTQRKVLPLRSEQSILIAAVT